MTNDPILRLVERLPRAEPDARRAERVRARCHAALARQRRPHEPNASTQLRTRLVWEPVAVVGFCVLYLAQVVLRALHLYGIR